MEQHGTYHKTTMKEALQDIIPITFSSFLHICIFPLSFLMLIICPFPFFFFFLCLNQSTSTMLFLEKKNEQLPMLLCVVFIILHEKNWHKFYYLKKCCNFGKLLTLCYAKKFKITRKFMQ